MKRLFCLILVVGSLFVLIACKKSEPKTTMEIGTIPETEETAAEETLTEATVEAIETEEAIQTTEIKTEEIPVTMETPPTTTTTPSTTTTKAPITTTRPLVTTTAPPVTTTTVPTTTKGPKPAKYTVVPAYDFPNDFPRDGWAWRYTTYAWYPNYASWKGDYLESVKWEVGLVGAAMNVEHLRAPETIENARKLMPPPPTLKESQKMIKYGEDIRLLKYGETNVYVCMEE